MAASQAFPTRKFGRPRKAVTGLAPCEGGAERLGAGAVLEVKPALLLAAISTRDARARARSFQSHVRKASMISGRASGAYVSAGGLVTTM